LLLTLWFWFLNFGNQRTSRFGFLKIFKMTGPLASHLTPKAPKQKKGTGHVDIGKCKNDEQNSERKSKSGGPMN
jgi:hypothetical protein